MRVPVQAAPVRYVAAGRTRSAPAARGVVPQDSCSVCSDILAGVIYAAANKATCWLGCSAVGTAVGAACDAAFGGPEDPVGDVVCPIAGTAASAICKSAGCSSLESWSGAQQAAQQICHQVGIC